MNGPQLASVVVLFLNTILFAAYVYVLVRDGRRRSRETRERYGTEDPDEFFGSIVIQSSRKRLVAFILLSGLILLALASIVLTADTWGALHVFAIAILSFLIIPAVGGSIGAADQIRASQMGLMRRSVVNGNSVLRWNEVRYILYDDENRGFIVSDGLSEDEKDPDAKDVEYHEFIIPDNMSGSGAMLKMVLDRVDESKWRNAKSLRKAKSTAGVSTTDSEG